MKRTKIDIYPVRCNCGRSIGHMADDFKKLTSSGYTIEESFTMLGVSPQRYHCRMALMNASFIYANEENENVIRGLLSPYSINNNAFDRIDIANSINNKNRILTADIGSISNHSLKSDLNMVRSIQLEPLSLRTIAENEMKYGKGIQLSSSNTTYQAPTFLHIPTFNPESQNDKYIIISRDSEKNVSQENIIRAITGSTFLAR